MKRISILALVALFLMSCTAFAQKTEYKNNQYNAGNIKTIVLVCNIPAQSSQNVIDQYMPLSYPDILIKRFSKNKNITVVKFGDLLADIYKTTGQNLSELNKTDPQLANNILGEWLKKYDAYLSVDILQYHLLPQYIPPATINMTQYRMVTVTNPYGGVSTVSVPYDVPINLPGFNTNSAAVELEFKLFDTKNSTLIFERKEDRVRESDRTNTADPKDVAKRIGESYVGDLLDKIHDDSKK